MEFASTLFKEESIGGSYDFKRELNNKDIP
jgi:hypothetical protein